MLKWGGWNQMCIRDREIVDTPAGVLLSCTETVGPPGVNALFIRIKIAECINKATLKGSGKAGSLFIRKACIFAVGLRVLEIDLLMCHIKVATACLLYTSTGNS